MALKPPQLVGKKKMAQKSKLRALLLCRTITSIWGLLTTPTNYGEHLLICTYILYAKTNKDEDPITLLNFRRALAQGLINRFTNAKQTKKRGSVSQHVRSILRLINVMRKHHLSPKPSKLYRSAVHFKRLAYSANKNLVSFKDRIAAAEEFSKTEQFNRMLLMTPAAQSFFNMQMRETTKKPRGRRFTTAEKVLTLTLFKQGPKAYTLLQKLFTLPSRSTMNMFLSSVSLRADVECSKRWSYIRDYYIRRRGNPGTGSSGEAAKKKTEQPAFLVCCSSGKRRTFNVEISDSESEYEIRNKKKYFCQFNDQ
ncbi:hypothetical protein CBL_08392 [Carabus blaptoides fortunei]